MVHCHVVAVFTVHLGLKYLLIIIVHVFTQYYTHDTNRNKNN